MENAMRLLADFLPDVQVGEYLVFSCDAPEPDYWRLTRSSAGEHILIPGRQDRRAVAEICDEAAYLPEFAGKELQFRGFSKVDDPKPLTSVYEIAVRSYVTRKPYTEEDDEGPEPLMLSDIGEALLFDVIKIDGYGNNFGLLYEVEAVP